MDRRTFMQSAGGLGMFSALSDAPAAAQQTERKTRLYRLEYMYLRQGGQGGRIDRFLSSQMPLIAKHVKTFGVFTAALGTYSPCTLIVAGFSDLDEMQTASAGITRDSAYRAAFEEMENGAEPPFDSAEQVLLRVLDFSPEVVPLAEKPKPSRYFELRTYHSPTQRQLRYLHERFAGPEIAIFHRSGVHPLFYTDTLIGPNMPNLTYFIPFDSLAAREKAWDAFGADPEWAKVRDDSIARGGQIVSHISTTLWRPAAYSPIQ